MGAAAYPKAAIPEPFQILGLRLKPFCLGHYLLMERFGCAFVAADSRTAELDDLVLGVLICSMAYGEFLEFIQGADWPEEVKAWGGKAHLFDLNEKVKLLQEYIRLATEQPVVIYERDTEPSGSHWSQALKLTLTGALGYTADQALNLPLSQAFADFYKHAENLGVVTIAPAGVEEILKSDLATDGHGSTQMEKAGKADETQKSDGGEKLATGHEPVADV